MRWRVLNSTGDGAAPTQPAWCRPARRHGCASGSRCAAHRSGAPAFHKTLSSHRGRFGTVCRRGRHGTLRRREGRFSGQPSMRCGTAKQMHSAPLDHPLHGPLTPAAVAVLGEAPQKMVSCAGPDVSSLGRRAGRAVGHWLAQACVPFAGCICSWRPAVGSPAAACAHALLSKPLPATTSAHPARPPGKPPPRSGGVADDCSLSKSGLFQLTSHLWHLLAAPAQRAWRSSVFSGQAGWRYLCTECGGRLCGARFPGLSTHKRAGPHLTFQPLQHLAPKPPGSVRKQGGCRRSLSHGVQALADGHPCSPLPSRSALRPCMAHLGHQARRPCSWHGP